MTQSRESAEANSFAEAFEASLNFKTPEQGELLRGQIVSISGDDAFISYGGPSEAVMAAAELDGLDIGDTVEGTVVKTAPEIRISRKLARGKASLDLLRQMYENRLPVEGKVAARNKGGFDVNVGGLRAFCPLSQIALGKIENADQFIGQTHEFRVTELSDDGRRISLSMKDQEPDPWSDVGERYPVGAQFSGTIVRTTDFGLFVEVEPGIDGLVHYSQLPFGVKRGDDAIAIGTHVTGWVREVDPSRKRLSLSLREIAASDPWEGAQQKYPIGKVIEGVVDHGAAPGIFVQIEPGLTGLIPSSEISVAPGADPSRAYEPGEKVVVRVMSVDPSRKRISLSVDAAKAAAEREEYVKFMDERDSGEGESAMALAFRRAMEKKK